MSPAPDFDAAVIGGGFYGSILASYASESGKRATVLIEKERALLARASFANQARVHGGYHYPRSLRTGSRSQANFGRFVSEFHDAVDGELESLYAVSRIFSNVTAPQFRLFCERIGAPIGEADPSLQELFREDLVEGVFRVREAVFDADKLRAMVWERLSAAGVDVRLGVEARGVSRLPSGLLRIELADGGEAITSRDVFDCTYSRLNHLLAGAGLPPIALKHELAEVALVRLPERFRRLGVTLMCGPFFSVLPFPPRGLHSLSHVRYTPHCAWRDDPKEPYQDPHALFDGLPRTSRHVEMIKDASRYLPLLAEAEYVDSLWETKTVLPRSEVDDSRPILFQRDYGFEGLHCVMGSKIDNVYDMIDFASAVLRER